jgi:integrase
MTSGRIEQKPKTINTDLTRIKMHIRPKLGKYRIASITSDTIEDFMHTLRNGTKKRTISLLSVMFNHAIKKKLMMNNPASAVEAPADGKKTRRLSNDEYRQLHIALPKLNSTVADVILFAAISGWRSSEVINLKFSECDLERKVVTLGATKTGVSVRPLSAEAIKLIEAQPRNGSTFVFDYNHGKPISTLAPHWRRLKLPRDVTPHTMRHSFASLAADMGLSDNTISGLLGHATRSMTSRYLHLADKALIDAVDLVATETLRLMCA